MSRILRRPLFRGGRVPSYGTGIASGLVDGGMPPKRGLVDGPGGYGGWEERSTGWGGHGNMILGSDLMNFVKQNPKYGSLDFANTLNPKQYYSKPAPYPGTDIWQIGRGGPKIENSPEFLKLWQNFMDPETMLINPDEVDIETGVETGSVSGDAVSGSEGDISTTVAEEKSNIDSSSVDGLDEKVLEIQNSDDAELSLEEIKEALGGDKARRRDLTDMALLASAKLLKPGATVKSGLSEFMEAEAAKGPSRTEVIDKEAATFMLKDKFQTKRDKAKIELMRADTDYKLAAGKKISVQEGVLLATKGSNFSDKKLGVGIQNATSDATGEKYKYKGTTDAAGLKAALNSGELKAGDTVIVKETIKVEGQPDKTIKKIIEIQLIDGKLKVEEIYRV